MYNTIHITVILVISCFVIIVENVDGQNVVVRGYSCNHQNQTGTNLYRLSLEQCKKECCKRPTCRGVDYFRMEHKCALLQPDDIYGIMDTDLACVHIRKTNIKCLNNCTCPEHENCDDVSETCAEKECPPFGQKPNYIVLGNMNEFGSRLMIKCAPGYRAIPNRSTTECLPTGSWSYKPQCIRVTIGETCSRDDDCVEIGSVCIDRTCFCGPLYRHNTTTWDCVKVCERMTTNFTAYPNTYILHSNLNNPCDTYDNRTCCIENPACLSYEYVYNKHDYTIYGSLSYEMAMDVNPSMIRKARHEILYSRKCN